MAKNHPAEENAIIKTHKRIVRIGGFLKEIITVKDKEGKVLHKIINPLMLDFRPRDALQVVVGSILLATPVMFTEEVWRLGEVLSVERVATLGILSVFFIAVFVYYNFYRGNLRGNKGEFLKRVLGIYLISCAVVALLLTLLEKAPWDAEYLVAIKRIIIIALPASMSAAVADMIK
jgi:uncharacterized membrane protein